jgi:hypothetical protein
MEKILLKRIKPIGNGKGIRFTKLDNKRFNINLNDLVKIVGLQEKDNGEEK